MPADATDDARRWALGEALLLSDELDDWGLGNADPARLEEFILYLLESDLHATQQDLMARLILCSANERLIAGGEVDFDRLLAAIGREPAAFAPQLARFASTHDEVERPLGRELARRHATSPASEAPAAPQVATVPRMRVWEPSTHGSGDAAFRAAERLLAAGAPGLPAAGYVGAWLLALDAAGARDRVARAIADGPRVATTVAILAAGDVAPPGTLPTPCAPALRAALAAGVRLPPVAPATDAHRATLLALGIAPVVEGEADEWISTWFSGVEPAVWPALAFPWVEDADTLELALGRWLELAQTDAAGALLTLWLERAGAPAVELLRRLFPGLPRRTRDDVMRWLVADGPAPVAAWMAELAAGDATGPRAIALAYARRNPAAIMPHLPADGRDKRGRRLAELRAHLEVTSAGEGALRDALGDGPDLAAARAMLAGAPTWATPRALPPCVDRAGAPVPAAVVVATVGALAEATSAVAHRLFERLAPTDLAALLAFAVAEARRRKEAEPHLAVGALARLPGELAAPLLTAWLPEIGWDTEALAGLARVPRAVLATAALACGRTAGQAEVARAAVRRFAKETDASLLKVWAAALPDVVEGRFVMASVREAALELAKRPDARGMVAATLKDHEGWRDFALRALTDAATADDARQDKRGEEHRRALESARGFLRGREPDHALVGLELDLVQLLARGFRQVERAAESWKWSRSTTRTRGGFTLELDHDDCALLDGRPRAGAPPVPLTVTRHGRLDPRSEDCLVVVHELLGCRTAGGTR